MPSQKRNSNKVHPLDKIGSKVDTQCDKCAIWCTLTVTADGYICDACKAGKPAKRKPAKSNKTAAPKQTRACVAHGRVMPCPTCKAVAAGTLPTQPIPSDRGAWVSMAVVDTPTGRKWVQRTDDSVPAKTTRRTSPANITATGQSFGTASVTARQMTGKPNNPAKNATGHPTFVRYFSRKGINYGVTARGDLWMKSAAGKWQRDRDFSNSGRTGVTNRRPEPNEFFNEPETVLGRVVPRAGTVGTVGRSPFQTRI